MTEAVIMIVIILVLARLFHLEGLRRYGRCRACGLPHAGRCIWQRPRRRK